MELDRGRTAFPPRSTARPFRPVAHVIVADFQRGTGRAHSAKLGSGPLAPGSDLRVNHSSSGMHVPSFRPLGVGRRLARTTGKDYGLGSGFIDGGGSGTIQVL